MRSLEPGGWQGPILSGFGTHLVYVHGVTRVEQPPLEAIREKLQEAWMLEQVESLSTEFIDELVSRYEIVVEETRVPLTVPPQQAGE
ncbi:MAG: peptidylprolyl isomerase [Halieaceae bacterium]